MWSGPVRSRSGARRVQFGLVSFSRTSGAVGFSGVRSGRTPGPVRSGPVRALVRSSPFRSGSAAHRVWSDRNGLDVRPDRPLHGPTRPDVRLDPTRLNGPPDKIGPDPTWTRPDRTTPHMSPDRTLEDPTRPDVHSDYT